MSDENIVIRRKINKGEPALSHGGWKVAMADLMISMMCLFLILWLLAIMDSKDKEILINYFAKGELQPEHLGEGLGNAISPIKLPHVATSREETELNRIEDDALIDGEVNSQMELQALAKRIEQETEKLDGRGSITTLITPQGLKLVLSDSEKGTMFYRGSARMTPYYQDLILALAPIFAQLKNSLIITGHTDASRFRSPSKTNWELSSERANRARYYLNRGGVVDNKIFQVSGMAETVPLKDNATHAENRRIEIFLLTRQAQEMLQQVYKSSDSLPAEEEQDRNAVSQFDRNKSQAHQAAEANRMTNPLEVLRRESR